MRKRAFENLVECKKTADDNGENFDVFGAFEVATAAGAPRQVARTVNLPATDVFNHALPTLIGTVIEAKNHPSPKMIGQIVITAQIEKFTTPDTPFQVAYNIPSGVGVMMALSKITSSAPGMDKVAKPHVCPEKFAIVPITGIVNFTLRASKNGRNGSDLRPDDLPTGTPIEVLRYVAEVKQSASGSTVYASADSISILSSKPPFVTTRAGNAIVKCFENTAIHREAAINIMRGTGDGSHPVLMGWLKEDALFLKLKLLDLHQALVGRKVGIGKPFETCAMSDEASAAINAAIEQMASLEQVSDASDLNIMVADLVEWLSKVDVSTQRYAPFLQTAASPFEKIYLECSSKGAGPMAQQHLLNIQNGLEVKGNFFTEALFESGKTTSDKSVGAMEYNVTSVSISMKHPKTGEWTGFTPKLKDGTAVCVGQFLQSAKRTAAPQLGTFDFYRMPMVGREIIPHMPMLVVLKRMPLNNTRVADTDVQPLVAGDWGVECILDYPTAILQTGIALSKTFVQEKLCDDGEVKVMPTKELFGYTDMDASGEPKPPSRPRFVETGFNALNTNEEVRIMKYIDGSNNPRGTEKVNFMAIYEGVATDVADDPTLSINTAKGDALMEKKMASDNTFATKKVVLYAIATEPEAKEDDEPKAKRAKTDTGSDSD